MAGQGGDDAQDKTEAPTPRRLEKAREDGQVALSKELAGFAALALAGIGLLWILPSLASGLMRTQKAVIARSHELGAGEVLRALAWEGFLLVTPVALLAALGGVGATLLQTRGLVVAKPLLPQFSRISPLAGLQRLFGPDGLAEFLRTLIKLGVIGAALWWAVAEPELLRAVVQEPTARLIGHVGEQAGVLLGAALLAFALVAVLDVGFARWRHTERLRMSRQELREELKETDGNPEFKARRLLLRRTRARRRMLAEVPKAAVVITNPTHYAVALAYTDGASGAPRVVAKGVDAMAARIRAAAEGARVPMVSNPPLARALFRVELDEPIPPEHYAAVAEIIAFVWRARGRR
jgi:flagellar biosynthetic protein FlhB